MNDQLPTIDESAIKPIEQETDITRLRQLASDYKAEYAYARKRWLEVEEVLGKLADLIGEANGALDSNQSGWIPEVIGRMGDVLRVENRIKAQE